MTKRSCGKIKKNILVIAAHPDDEVIGCGGTMARFAKEGSRIFTVILGEGITSRDESRDRGKREQQIQELKKQIKKANNILGVKESFVFDLPDNRFDTVPLLDIIKIIERIKHKINPGVVFTHHRGDLNIDHKITLEAVMAAFRPLKGSATNEIYSFEVASSTEWSAVQDSNYFKPNFFVDITNTLKKKIKAFKEYRSELRDFPHPRSPEAVEIIAKRRGIEAGLKAAEAFEVIRLIRS